MTIYVDVVLMENIIINYIILYATGTIYKMKPKPFRLFLSSALGAVYAILSYMQILKIFEGLIFKLILSISMVYIALNAPNLKTLMKQVLAFYLTSFIFGGVSFALLYYVNPQDILMKNGIYIGTYPIKIVFISAIIGMVVIKFTFKMIKGKISKKELICKIKVKILEKTVEMNAMIDTGNLLKEPITGESVIIVEKQIMQNIIPETILNNIDKILKGEYVANLGELSTRVRVIPFTSLGNESGMLLGIMPDGVWLETEQGDVNAYKTVIGLYNGNLTKNKLYSALIGVDILERSNNDELAEGIKRKG